MGAAWGGCEQRIGSASVCTALGHSLAGLGWRGWGRRCGWSDSGCCWAAFFTPLQHAAVARVEFEPHYPARGRQELEFIDPTLFFVVEFGLDHMAWVLSLYALKQRRQRQYLASADCGPGALGVAAAPTRKGWGGAQGGGSAEHDKCKRFHDLSSSRLTRCRWSDTDLQIDCAQRRLNAG